MNILLSSKLPTWTCCCKQTEVWWPSGKENPDWTLSMESSEWGSARTPPQAGWMHAGVTGVSAGGDLGGRCLKLEEEED